MRVRTVVAQFAICYLPFAIRPEFVPRELRIHPAGGQTGQVLQRLWQKEERRNVAAYHAACTNNTASADSNMEFVPIPPTLPGC